jgi:phosphoribosylaminoimidazolecarboxamide formyltransferase / IMP cyclohydrolase
MKYLMKKQIKSALISVFYKNGLENIIQLLHKNNITIYSTGGTQTFIEDLGIPCIAVEHVTYYPSILGGRVKTLHPKIFGGILGKRSDDVHLAEMQHYNIPELDLVIVDLYPFEETVANTTEEHLIIEKIDIGGPSMIRAAAKNYTDVTVIASKKDYEMLEQILETQHGTTELQQRKHFAIRAFQIVAQYDMAIANWFLHKPENNILIQSINGTETVLRYGENPHQAATFNGDLHTLFTQLHGKELSYNNLVDVDAALQFIAEFSAPTFGIIKHTNTCGAASSDAIESAWSKALAGDPESAFGGVLVCNGTIESITATAISDIFFEVLIAEHFTTEALEILQKKKNRILLQKNKNIQLPNSNIKTILNGVLSQEVDKGNYNNWTEVGGRICTDIEKENLEFANLVCKHLKSNAIALIKNKQLIGKGCGQTSRVDALRYAIEKANQFQFDLMDAVLASDAFFPFDDCVKIAHQAGITAFIQPGGSMRDADSIDYCKANNLAMVLTGQRHFKH